MLPCSAPWPISVAGRGSLSWLREGQCARSEDSMLHACCSDFHADEPAIERRALELRDACAQGRGQYVCMLSGQDQYVSIRSAEPQYVSVLIG